MAADPIYTVGHSTRTIDELVALLRAHGIEIVVDVRRYPASRRHPQFGGPALKAALNAAGVDYAHEVDLGGRREPRPDSPNDAWRNAGFRGYADHMTTPEFRGALARVERLAANQRVAVMCAEAVPWRCHRRLIADALVARGKEVRHIFSEDRADPHALHDAARRSPDGLIYPAPAPEQPELGFSDD